MFTARYGLNLYINFSLILVFKGFIDSSSYWYCDDSLWLFAYREICEQDLGLSLTSDRESFSTVRYTIFHFAVTENSGPLFRVLPVLEIPRR